MKERTRLPLLVNNSRLLVLPAGPCPNLISRFMKRMLARLSPDWQPSWGHPLVLAETFVDPHLDQGAAYQVSGWNRLGQTAGWKRSAEDFYQKPERPKQGPEDDRNGVSDQQPDLGATGRAGLDQTQAGLLGH